jgi:Skp family chaperone for outer membrane proteins
VKKTIACVAGAIALVSGFGAWSGWAPAQQPGTPGGQPIRQVSTNPPAAPAPTAAPSSLPGTRVAVVNINKVLKEYQKAQSLNNSIKVKVQGYARRMEEKRKELTDRQAELTKPGITAPQREQIEKQILALQRELQDIDAEARKVIGKEQGDIAVMIFREIEMVIQAVATANGFDLVLSYPDATDPAEVYAQDNIVRKLASQAAMPLFYKPHIDMTRAVIDTLNRSYPPAAGAATPGGAAAPPGTPHH